MAYKGRVRGPEGAERKTRRRYTKKGAAAEGRKRAAKALLEGLEAADTVATAVTLPGIAKGLVKRVVKHTGKASAKAGAKGVAKAERSVPPPPPPLSKGEIARRAAAKADKEEALKRISKFRNKTFRTSPRAGEVQYTLLDNDVVRVYNEASQTTTVLEPKFSAHGRSLSFWAPGFSKRIQQEINDKFGVLLNKPRLSVGTKPTGKASAKAGLSMRDRIEVIDRKLATIGRVARMQRKEGKRLSKTLSDEAKALRAEHKRLSIKHFNLKE